MKIIIITHTDFPHYEGLSQRIMGLCNVTKFGSFFVLAPAVEKEKINTEHIGNLQVIRYRLLFLRKIMRNRFLYRLLLNIFFSLALFLDIAKLKRLQANIIQAEQQLSLLPSLIIGSILRKPIILDDIILMDEELKARIPNVIVQTYKIIEKIAINLCFATIFSSHVVKEKYNSLKCLVVVVPNGIFKPSPPHFSPKPRTFDTKTLLFLGSMYNRQNRQALAAAIKIFQKIKENENDISLIILGGPLYLLDEETIEAAKKDNRIMILGYISDKLKCYFISKADLILMPFFDSPLTGGIRIKALEFFSYGKVVITTSDGVKEITGIKDGKNVLIAETPQEFVNVITDYLLHSERYAEVGNGAKKLAQRYLWDKVIMPYQSLLSHIVYSYERKSNTK